MDMWFKATKRRRRKFKPRVCVWKLKEEKTCEEFRCMVGDMVEEVKWKGLGVNDHCQQMKDIMMETAQDICGMTEGPCRHKETWWWNEEVAEAVRYKKKKSTESGRKKTRKRQGWNIRRADKMQRELSLQQRKRNRRSGQMT